MTQTARRRGDGFELNAAILQTVEDTSSKGRFLVFGQPHAENLASAVDAHADGQMHGHVPDAGTVADLELHRRRRRARRSQADDSSTRARS